MFKKSFIICLFILFTITLLDLPALADISVSGHPMTVGWPTLNGSLPKAQTCDDPNELPKCDSCVYATRLQADFTNGAAICQSFSTDGNTDGFALTRIAIRASGIGSSDPDINGPFTLHIFDLNATYGWAPPYNLYSYSPSVDGLPYAGTLDFLSSPGFCADPCLMAYASENSDTLVYFDFNGFDRVDLEPNHTYAVEIWGPYGWTQQPPFVFYWIWCGQVNPYAGGAAYRVGGYDDNGNGPGPSNLTNLRWELDYYLGSDTVTAVYGDSVDGNAYHPSPRKGQTVASLTPTLTWHPGKWAKNHQVWFSTSFNKVAQRNSPANMGRFTNPSYTPAASLAANTTYYWRVDEYNDTNTVPVPHHPDGNNYWGVDSNPIGDNTDRTTIWCFRTLAQQAYNPIPATGSTAAFKVKNSRLSWTAGDLVAATNGHNFYFGTSFNDVNNATTATSVIYRGSTTDPCYPLKNLYSDYTLTSGSIYYWRVDEVNGPNTWKGPTWNFKMPNPAFIVIDDFNYPTQTAFNNAWQSGYQNNGGSISASGQVMTLDYNNSGSAFDNWSEAKLDFNSPAGIDLTLGGVFAPKAIGVQFDGQVDLNNLDPTYNKIYIGLEDTNGHHGFVYLNSDPYAAQRQITIDNYNPAVREFKVALTDPNFSGIDLTEVNRVYLGIGIRGLAGEVLSLYKGRLKFANLRVYVQHCNPSYPMNSMVAGDLAGPVLGALNGEHTRLTTPDCVVNYNDVYFLVQDWLFNEPNLVYDSNIDPGVSNLAVWYKFDEGTGTLLADSSGNHRDATLYNVGPLTWAYAGHNGGGFCVNLEPGQRTWIECPNTVVANVGGQTGQSFTFWLKYDDRFLEEQTWSSVLVFHKNAPGGGDSQTLETELPVPFQNGQQAMPWLRFVDVRTSAETGLMKVRASMISSRWNHYALVYDTPVTQMSIYINGAQVAATTNSAITRVWGPNATGDGNANTVRIGTRGNALPGPLPLGAGNYDVNNNQFWQGRIDDMRLYSKALSENEIQYLATDGTGRRDMQAVFIEPDDYINTTITLPTGPAVHIVNFNDFAVLAGYWLNQQYWP